MGVIENRNLDTLLNSALSPRDTARPRYLQCPGAGIHAIPSSDKFASKPWQYPFAHINISEFQLGVLIV